MTFGVILPVGIYLTLFLEDPVYQYANPVERKPRNSMPWVVYWMFNHSIKIEGLITEPKTGLSFVYTINKMRLINKER